MFYRTAIGFVAFAACRTERPVVVHAAASTVPAMEAALATWGEPATINAAASSVLAKQIEQGAPGAVFLSASPAWADAVVAVDRVDLLGNELVLVGLESGPDLADLVSADCVAVGDPDHVPAGQYARQALTATGQWGAVAPRVVPTLDAPAAVAAVRHGACDVGIAYRTDATGVEVGAVLATDPPVVYPLVLLDEDGRPLFDWLQGDAARAVFERHGFSVR